MPEEQLQPREGEAGEGSEDGEQMRGRGETRGGGCQVGLRAEKGQGGLPPAFRMRTEAEAKWARSASLVVGDVKHYSK